ncbi:hypothetical protein Trydic_g22861 [Trypoxylus dichotomus]
MNGKQSNTAVTEYIKAHEMASTFTMLLLTILATVRADPENTPAPSSQAHPQLQYPPFSGGSPRVQPQVLVYPGGAPGQPFLLQPGTPPGNFLIPQPQPGFVFRDVPNARPDVFVSGYPKPSYVPPINKDAEEIPINPGAIQPNPSFGRKPEKLETFDEKPEEESATAEEAHDLASADRTLGRAPALRPGHRFFILNGQPLFSNYPLPQFADSPYQPSVSGFGPVEREFYTYRQNDSPFLPEGFAKQQVSNNLPDKVPVGNFFVRNSVTGQINGAKDNNYEKPQNDIDHSQNFVSLNQRDQPTPDILFKSLQVLPYKKQNLEQAPQIKINKGYQLLKLKPIDVPDSEDASALSDTSEDFRKDKESITIFANPEAIRKPILEETPTAEKAEEPGISRSQPNALALAGPGGIAAAAPRATALTGDRGVSVSSPQATAIAGPSKDQIQERPIDKSKKP